jgi:aminoglycoside phosphotransferase family enzyme
VEPTTRQPLAPAAPAIGIAEKVAFLKRPESYPESPGRVEPVETHLAWVFLTDRHAYKLKKPVRYPFLDFGTLAARRRDAEEEVRLNRRLAPGVYLGVVTLAAKRDGELALEARGEPVEWLVKMRRLPRARMLDFAIASQTVDAAGLKAVAELLATFYREATPVAVTPVAYRHRFQEEIESDTRALAEPRYGLPADAIARTAAAQRAFIERQAVLLNTRAAAGRIVEGHGDLRPEHVCLGPPPVIIDCVAFNRDFRILDPADELAYLGMECERLGAEGIGTALLARYAALTGDQPAEPLISFYKSVRAVLRAKLAAWHLDDRTVPYPSQWFNRARAYLALAERYSQQL